MTKICTKCKIKKELSLKEFPPNPKMKSKLDSWCRSCRRKIAIKNMRRLRGNPTTLLKILISKKKYAQSPKGKKRKRMQSMISNHKRRERHLATEWNWTEKMWEECKNMWDKRCAYCGEKKELTQDHFIPLVSPLCPGTVQKNMVPACKRCNTSKQHHNPFEWCKNKKRLALIVEKLSLYEKVLSG